MGYNFEVEWLAGKKNLIADALSRIPHFNIPEEDKTPIISPCYTAVSCLIDHNKQHHISLTQMAQEADDNYKSLLASILNSNTDDIPNVPSAKQFQKYFHRLSACPTIKGLILCDSSKIVIPSNFIKRILSWLHTGHTGFQKTLALAKSMYFWHGMNNDIKTFVNACKECQILKPSIQKITMLKSQSYEEERPMETVGTDLFSYKGKDYIVLVDRYSGFILCSDPLPRTSSSKIISILDTWFQLFGFPQTIRSDGGPQYRSEFTDYCKSKNIKHEVSSPYNPQSNGLAESAVKIAKHLLIKCSESKENFQAALSFWRNVPKESGFSPAALFFGRQQQTALPSLPQHHAEIDRDTMNAVKQISRAKIMDAFNKRAKDAPALSVGENVLVQHPDSKLWCIKGYIKSIRPDGLSFEIELPTGQVIVRGRRLVQKDLSFQSSEKSSDFSSNSHNSSNTSSRPPSHGKVPTLRRNLNTNSGSSSSCRRDSASDNHDNSTVNHLDNSTVNSFDNSTVIDLDHATVHNHGNFSHTDDSTVPPVHRSTTNYPSSNTRNSSEHVSSVNNDSTDIGQHRNTSRSGSRRGKQDSVSTADHPVASDAVPHIVPRRRGDNSTVPFPQRHHSSSTAQRSTRPQVGLPRRSRPSVSPTPVLPRRSGRQRRVPVRFR